MKKFSFLISIFLVSYFAKAQTGKDAYLLYNENGKKANYKELLNKAKDADVILFGELHDNPICHRLQL